MDKKKNVTLCPPGLEEQPPAAQRMTEAELKREWQFFRASSLVAENIKKFSPKLGKLYDF